MPWILKLYLFCVIFCIACSWNACVIVRKMGNEIGYEFDKTTLPSILRLIVVAFIPIYNIFASCVWLFASTDMYVEAIKKTGYRIDE